MRTNTHTYTHKACIRTHMCTQAQVYACMHTRIHLYMLHGHSSVCDCSNCNSALNTSYFSFQCSASQAIELRRVGRVKAAMPKGRSIRRVLLRISYANSYHTCHPEARLSTHLPSAKHSKCLEGNPGKRNTKVSKHEKTYASF